MRLYGGTTTVPLLAEGVPVPAGTRHNHKPWLNILPAVSCAWRGEAGNYGHMAHFRKAEPYASHKVGSSWPRGASFDFRDNATFVFGLTAALCAHVRPRPAANGLNRTM